MNAPLSAETNTAQEDFVWHASVAIGYAEELLSSPDVSPGQWRLLAERVMKIKGPMYRSEGRGDEI